MNFKRVVCLAAVFVLVVGGVGWAAKDLVGKTAPEFTLKDLNGKSFSLKDYRGKIVVLEWANKDCPIWRNVLQTLNDTYKEHADKDVVWLNIDSTHNMDLEDHRVFMIKNDVTKPVLDDRSGKVGKAYGARTTPHMFIINKEGRVVYDGAIDNKAKGDEHVNFVAKALKELKSGKTISKPSTNPYGCSVKYKK